MTDIKPLVWSDPIRPNHKCSYDHVVAETPFGRFLITWKGWKESPDPPTIDETPWNDFGGFGWNLDDAKRIAEKEYQNRVRKCLAP